jgi:protein TonB
MFDQLPETNPNPKRSRRKAMLAAACIQLVFVSTLILIQMLMPEKLGPLQLISTIYMAPPPPPAPPAAPVKAVREPLPKKTRQAEAIVPEIPPKPIVTPPVVSTPAPVPEPTPIPEPATSNSGVAGGLPGGVPGGQPGGAVGGVPEGVVDGNGNMPVPAAPKEPVRVGGNVREPKIVDLVQPQYPSDARKAHIEGVVVLEAVVTETGRVEKVKVISGPQQLVAAAIDAVRKWRYEPTVLNGQPVPVILTARINFALSKSGT